MTGQSDGTKQDRRVIWPVQSLNFFMADVQAGIGTFLGVFLLAHRWESGWIGMVMLSLGGNGRDGADRHAGGREAGEPGHFRRGDRCDRARGDGLRLIAREADGGAPRLLAAFVDLVRRAADPGCLVAAHLITAWGVYPAQTLDRVGAGLQSVAVPGLVARILDGTGRVNVAHGAVMTVQGIGASLSPAIEGWIAQGLGYPAMFVGFAGTLRAACGGER